MLTFLVFHMHRHFQSLTMLHLELTPPLLLFKNQSLKPVANETHHRWFLNASMDIWRWREKNEISQIGAKAALR